MTRRIAFPIVAMAATSLLVHCDAEPRAERQRPVIEGSASDAGTPFGSGVVMSAGDGGASEFERILGPFLAGHWVLPIAPQGPPPAGFSEPDASLEPAVCGSCHPKQYDEWRTSLHAAAFSPGFAGQLVEGPLAHPSEVRACQSCHAPLAEQQPYDSGLAPNPDLQPTLRAQGLVCASCHVRRHTRFGPPRRPEAPTVPEPVPHAGFETRIEFQESRFCVPCHQFVDDPGVNGKPIENTYTEWQNSPQAAEGRTCQSCHMPDRAHLWRGIHDREMVRRAVGIALAPLEDPDRGLPLSLVLANVDVGHAFPTYVTPRVFLSVWQVDAQGVELEGTRIEAVIGREVDFSTSPWREVFDTRVMPGESVRLDYREPRHEEATAVVGRVDVAPDHHYREVFASLLATLTQHEARSQIERAHAMASESPYVLAELRRELPPPASETRP